MEQVRDQKGRYSRKGVWVGAVIGVATIILFAGHFGDMWVTKEISATNEVKSMLPVAFAESKVDMEARVEAYKNDIVERLAKCESGGKKEEDGITTLDSNDKGSYGPLQFQRKTVMFFYPKMAGKEINGRDAIILALQGDKSRELAKYIIFSTENGVASDWVNCSKRLGLQAEVNVIKNLEK